MERGRGDSNGLIASRRRRHLGKPLPATLFTNCLWPGMRWADVLANRFAAASLPKGVVSESIAGNRIIADGGNGPSGLDRLDRDVLDRAGATHVVYFMGSNDLAGLATSKEAIDASLNLISRVRAKGLKIIGALIMKPQYACGDYIHANAAGYQLTGNAIDLNLFK